MPNDMVLVYDIRRDERAKQQLLPRFQAEWDAYLNGKMPIALVEGPITALFYATYEGEPRFTLHEGKNASSWIRMGDDSWYAVGRQARVEQAIFHVPSPIGDMPIITRIWIGKDTE